MTTEYISLDIGTSVKEALMLVKSQARCRNDICDLCR